MGQCFVPKGPSLSWVFLPVSYMLATILVTSCDTSTVSPDETASGALVINEFLAGNDTTNADEFDEYDDWVELYNGTSEPLDIGGMYISDDPLDPLPWQIPVTAPELTTVQSQGFLVLWCDEDTDQGALHVGIKLSVAGEAIVLWASDRRSVVDSLSYQPQISGVSWGRRTDGAELWQTFNPPTPGTSNQSGTSP